MYIKIFLVKSKIYKSFLMKIEKFDFRILELELFFKISIFMEKLIIQNEILKKIAFIFFHILILFQIL